MSRTQRVLLVLLVPIVLLGAVLIGRAVRSGDTPDGVQVANADDVSSFEHEYTIPAGTAARIADGEQIDIVPRVLTVRVGEAIRIVNDDDEGHRVGVFYVGAGETMTQKFTAAGELSGSCSVHSGGQFTLLVEA